MKIPAWLVMMEKVLKAQVSNGQKIVFDKSSQFAVQGGEYFTGVSLSWADLVVYNLVSHLASVLESASAPRQSMCLLLLLMLPLLPS